MTTSARDSLIIRTKLHPPSVATDIVRRTTLEERLDRAQELPLTLLSAPAGYGKSTLVACWLQACSMPNAWVSLDESEGDVRIFLHYFVAAIRTIFPEACQETRVLLEAGEMRPAVLAGELANDLDELDQAFILVLDDAHNVHALTVYAVLDRLLEHPPPALHLVIITRRDPPLSFATLRARGKMIEIREQDLRFTQEETRLVLQKTAEVSPGEKALSHLDAEIEGWIVGLRLVCLALRYQENPDTYLKRLSGGPQSIQSYLIEQVLAKQTPAFQQCLLKTSILERLCAPLCDAIFGLDIKAMDTCTTGESFLRDLERGNLFASRLDLQGDWLRYHKVFQQLLQRQLERQASAADIAKLHALASEWCENEGFIDESIRHALSTGNPVAAAEIVERHRHAELDQDRWYVVQRWLAMLPEEMTQQRLGLVLAHTWTLEEEFRLTKIPAMLVRAESVLADQTENGALLGELDFQQGYMLYLQGQGERALQKLEQAQKRVSKAHRMLAGELQLYLALSRQMIGQRELAIRSVKEQIQESGLDDYVFFWRLLGAEVLVHLLSGDLEVTGQSVQRMQRMRRLTKTTNNDYASAWANYLWSNARFQAHEPGEALHGFLLAAERSSMIHRRMAADTLAGLVLTYHTLGDAEGARRTIGKLQEFAQETGSPEYLDVAESCQARLSLLRGDLRPAVAWARSYAAEMPAPTWLFWVEIPAITQVRVLLATSSHGLLQQAGELLAILRQKTEPLHNVYQTIQILVLQSLALEKQERDDDAMEVLEKVVALARPGGWIRPFVEAGANLVSPLMRLKKRDPSAIWVEEILSALGKTRKSPTVAARKDQEREVLIEPLTNRELDILELLAGRLYDKEIADRLFISTGTVKTHLKHIYAKLNVGNRRKAVLRAQHLGLLKTG